VLFHDIEQRRGDVRVSGLCLEPAKEGNGKSKRTAGGKQCEGGVGGCVSCVTPVWSAAPLVI